MIAPPQMPVIRIPAKEPWCVGIEFSPSEIIIGYITAMKNHTAGNAKRVIPATPNKAIDKAKIANTVKRIRIFLVSNNLTRIKPTKVPAVIIPQNQETT